MRVTIREVAKRAGVSAATVSRVLNKPNLVEKETRRRVQAAMKELDFKPNAIARGLSSRQTDTLGLIVPAGITDFFFNELYQGIREASQSHNMRVLVFDSENSPERAMEGFYFLGQHQVDGIIFTSKMITEDFDPVIQRLGLPVVLVLAPNGAKTPIPSFDIDNVRAGFDVVSYLVSRGHRRIGMIAGKVPDTPWQQRLQGYESGLKHFGLPFDSQAVQTGEFSFDDGYRAMQRLLEKQADLQLTAVFSASDEMALGAMRCLYDNGLRVPDDMSIVGFDDVKVARMVVPRLTTVAQPFSEIGAQSVHWLMGALGRVITPSETGTYFLPHRFVERESVRTLV
ncbi:LacI family DNA-binding transcriptional regulator [Alicyclobacillus acidoterrestris]|uniref:LacI family DNA-binding transcriptional regulator n=1 Tax=Alicyclobacillus acidoterrestris TaxID=1450 RepID=UPI003F535368